MLVLPYFVLGLGANILVGDRGISWSRHSKCRPTRPIREDGRVWCESGVIMRDLIAESVRRGWSGLEHYVGIPSTVGGAVWQNLHFLSPAPERERTMFIDEVFESAELLDERNAAPRRRPELHAVWLRHQRPSSTVDEVALAVTFRLAPGDQALCIESCRKT